MEYCSRYTKSYEQQKQLTDRLIIIWVNTLWALNLLLAGQGLGSFLMAEDGMSLANRGTMNLDDENNVLTIEVSQLFFKDIIVLQHK